MISNTKTNVHRFVFNKLENQISDWSPRISMSGNFKIEGWSGHHAMPLMLETRGQTLHVIQSEPNPTPEAQHAMNVLERSHQTPYTSPAEYRHFLASHNPDSIQSNKAKVLWGNYISLKEGTLAWRDTLPDLPKDELKTYVLQHADQLFDIAECAVDQAAATQVHFVTEEAFDRDPITPPANTAQVKSNGQYKVLTLTPKGQATPVLATFKIQTKTKSDHDGVDIEHGDQLAVNNECQQLGLGSILLQRTLAQCKTDAFEINASVDTAHLPLYVAQFGGTVIGMPRRKQEDGTYVNKARIRFNAKKSAQIRLDAKDGEGSLGAKFQTIHTTRLSGMSRLIEGLQIDPTEYARYPDNLDQPEIKQAVAVIHEAIDAIESDEMTLSFHTGSTHADLKADFVLYITLARLTQKYNIDGCQIEGSETLYHFSKKPDITHAAHLKYKFDARTTIEAPLTHKEEHALREFLDAFKNNPPLRQPKIYTATPGSLYGDCDRLSNIPTVEQCRFGDTSLFRFFTKRKNHIEIHTYLDAPVMKFRPCMITSDVCAVDAVLMEIWSILKKQTQDADQVSYQEHLFVTAQHIEQGALQYRVYIDWATLFAAAEHDTEMTHAFSALRRSLTSF